MTLLNPMRDDWERPVQFPKLIENEVQVWQIDLGDFSTDEELYLRLLSAAEVERASRLRVGQVRMQFLVGRSCVRKLLGLELGVAPELVPIVAGEYGKPELGSVYTGRVYFNVAHSRSTILVALSLSHPVGIDVEYLDRQTDVTEMARHSLSAIEAEAVLAMQDPSDRCKAFFECWTRKEAVVKSDGRGLSLPLPSIEVPVGALPQAFSLQVDREDGQTSRRYFVQDIALGEGLACALAIANVACPVRLLKFPPADIDLRD